MRFKWLGLRLNTHLCKSWIRSFNKYEWFRKLMLVSQSKVNIVLLFIGSSFLLRFVGLRQTWTMSFDCSTIGKENCRRRMNHNIFFASDDYLLFIKFGLPGLFDFGHGHHLPLRTVSCQKESSWLICQGPSSFAHSNWGRSLFGIFPIRLWSAGIHYTGIDLSSSLLYKFYEKTLQ